MQADVRGGAGAHQAAAGDARAAIGEQNAADVCVPAQQLRGGRRENKTKRWRADDRQCCSARQDERGRARPAGLEL